jgi:hypothetical protein
MNTVAAVIALSGVILVGTEAYAGDSTSQRVMSKRETIAQVIGCMKKRMSANQSRSYNDAMKVCKDQINKESDNLPSDALVASDTPPKR